MRSIAFIDLEINANTGEVLDYGCIMDSGLTLHTRSSDSLMRFLSNAEFICGHNLLKHDIKYLQNIIRQMNIPESRFVDTLFLSPLLFPKKPYHALLKDEKLQTDELNNPLNDAIKAEDLLYDEIESFKRLDESLKTIYYLLLHDTLEFGGFFRFMEYEAKGDAEDLISRSFEGSICRNTDLSSMIREYPIELAYCLANLKADDRFSIHPAWVFYNYPHMQNVIHLLRNSPCLRGCSYCDQALDPSTGLKKYFGFDSYRQYGGKPLQEMSVRAALHRKSILVIFPTGGGKSIAFQVPALMAGENTKGLTVVISPLQSLMKDQVDNLEKSGITEAVTINGLLDPIERAKSIERVRDGSASILYIAPESLRSVTIENLLLGRRIERFVIDEAHCFSAWGHDFRVDYLYIGKFLTQLQANKNLDEPIPVSCFTATAKQAVIEDIRSYFKSTMGLELEVFQSDADRDNLNYKVLVKENEADKYKELRNLIEAKKCPTIVYVSRTKKAGELADALGKDGFSAKAFHGKMDIKEKIRNQNEFISGEIQVMVATSAFGMGVDKKDVGLVVHYDISDSLENYIQEAGRAGRDEHIRADCYILFNETDLDKHFALLNRTRIDIKEIQQVWKAIKDLSLYKKTISRSALEIAKTAGWDEGIEDIETRVRTAICALEESGFLSRLQNMPKVYADSILCRTAEDADAIIKNSRELSDQQKVQAIRIMKNLIGSRSRSKAHNDEAEARVDYIADLLGLTREEVVSILNVLREIGLLASTKDLTAYISRNDKENRSLHIAESYMRIELFLLDSLSEDITIYNIKELNEKAEQQGCTGASANKIMTVFRYWKIKNWIRYEYQPNSRNHVHFTFIEPPDQIRKKIEIRQELARFTVGYLFGLDVQRFETASEKLNLIDFSVHEIKKAYEESAHLQKISVSIADVEDALFFLSRMDAIQIEGGFFVIYNPMSLKRIEDDPKRRYKKEDYQKLEQHFNAKMQQIHIVGEYARMMVADYQRALQFVNDYFHLNYSAFLDKYFKGARKTEINRNITPGKFRELFGELSLKQLSIINDRDHQYIAVIAGPGSGKTRILVHKLASLLLMEDVKHEQLLMLTFTRAAATEFKQRLIKLIGSGAHFIEIKTFHSYCFDLIGKVGNIEKTDHVIRQTIEKIQNGDVDPSRIAKTVLVIDEAQDMDQDVYHLITTLMERNEEMRVIAVGDDDQSIFEFRGSSSSYLKQFVREKKAYEYELLTNYRCKNNLVEFANAYASQAIKDRMKTHDVMSYTKEDGTIEIHQYKNDNLIYPIVDSVVHAERKGSCCILTVTNEQALLISTLLNEKGVPTKLLQSIEGFRLSQLVEFRYFMQVLTEEENSVQISKELWEKGKRELSIQFNRSTRRENCLKMIQDFESVHPVYKYRTDLETFIQESHLEDFYPDIHDVVYISTIHKSKGKEYDQVFLLLERFRLQEPEDRRKLYVAFTRPRSLLSIYLSDSYLNRIRVTGMQIIKDEKPYPLPNQIVLQSGIADVHLDYFISRQELIRNLQCGDILQFSDTECMNSQRKSVLRFSKKFVTELTKKREAGYHLQSVRVGFIVYWNKEGDESPYQVVLPEVRLQKDVTSTLSNRYDLFERSPLS